ncbi:MAG: hypothetical protein CL609_18475 [Anaerolineaceae bacterium]|nr:hypothetical protein [Anaerolineaceae bacterium]
MILFGVNQPIYHNCIFINDLIISHNGDIWVATDEEIYVFHDEILKEHFRKRDGVTIGIANKLMLGLDNTIWVGSSEGVSHFDGEEWVGYKEEVGYTEEDGNTDYLHDMAIDPKGRVWVLTNSGLFSFDGTEWTDHKLKGYYTELEIDENGTVWLASDTLTKYIPAEAN